ncbi:MAG: glycosyltransferase family 2 protein [Saprospiraceae bacterium]
MTTAQPTFTIITVVYNGEQLLPGTMNSVFSQTYIDYEYLIVDGASRDSTRALIAAAEDRFEGRMRWLSEPDKGLYDAMNKGLRLAEGTFVWFLNAGDYLHAADTLEQVAAKIGPLTDVLYGDTLLVNDDRAPLGLMSVLSTRSLPAQLHWRDYLGGMRVVHQSFVPRLALAPKYETGNLCADYDWCIRILKQSRENVHTGLVLSDYLAGGLSKKRHRQSLLDRFRVMQRHFGLGAALRAHVFIVWRAVVHLLRRGGRERY